MLTNNSNLSPSIAVFLAQDDYDYTTDPKVISTTTLIKPIKQIVLSRRLVSESNVIDITSLIPSRIGTAIHSAIENAWSNESKVKETLTKLGYPSGVVNRIKINPENPEDCIPVYLEKRSFKEIDGYTISGKFDFVMDGRLEDIKSTATRSWTDKDLHQKYIEQGSIYRWLNPSIITSDIMAIQFIFTNWSAKEAIKDKEYPQSRIIEKRFNLLSLQETENLIRSKLRAITSLVNSPEDQIPACTSKDLWLDDPVWKYYKDPTKKTRSTKNFDNEFEANKKLADDGFVGEVVKVSGNPRACSYCSALPICNQAKAMGVIKE